MGSLLAVAAIVATGLTLTVSAIAHLVRPGTLPAALRAQHVLPAAAAVPVVAAEAGAAALVWTVPELGLPLAAALLLCFAGYAAYVLRTRPYGVPCGCGAAAEAPLNMWTAVRAGALAALALAGSAGDTGGLAGARLASAVVAGAALAVLLEALPGALHDPDREVTG